jgi:CMP-N-acetylneuraminic acid synthetase
MSAFQSRQGFPSNGSFPFIMQQSDSIDIDSLVDLDLAELAMGKINA